MNSDMSAGPWLKLWVDILDDPKISRLPDWAFRRFIYFLLVAKEVGGDGELLPVPDLAWRLRLSEKQVCEALSVLSEAGIVANDGKIYRVLKFNKRQGPSSASERTLRWRNRKKELKNKPVTMLTSQDSDSDSVFDSKNVSNAGSDSGLVFKAYESNIGVLTPAICDLIKTELEDLSTHTIIAAIEEAAKQNVRRWSYIKTILDKWRTGDDNSVSPNISATIKELEYKSLDNPEFYKAWDDWVIYRKEIKHKLTELTIKTQLKKLSNYDTRIAIAMIYQSIENGWQGLFDVKNAEKYIPPAKADREAIREKYKELEGVGLNEISGVIPVNMEQ